MRMVVMMSPTVLPCHPKDERWKSHENWVVAVCPNSRTSVIESCAEVDAFWHTVVDILGGTFHDGRHFDPDLQVHVGNPNH